ncbi:sarcosine oxidase subunit gamma [Bradyrhizobium sp. i1.4.4]
MLDCSGRRLHSLWVLAHAPRNVQAASLDILPDAAKFAFRGRPSAVEAAGNAFGVELPQSACRFNVRNNRSAFWLGPDEWLIIASGEQSAKLFASVQRGLAGHSSSLVDVSHRSDAFAISGTRSDYVVNHGCPLDLSIAQFPVGMCTRTIVGKAAVILSRPKPDTFHLDVWRSFAPYVWQLLDDARSELAP